MFELGVIGYGSMGSMLLNGFLKAGALSEDQVIVSTRTRSKLNDIKNRLPGITIADNNLRWHNSRRSCSWRSSRGM